MERVARDRRRLRETGQQRRRAPEPVRTRFESDAGKSICRAGRKPRRLYRTRRMEMERRIVLSNGHEQRQSAEPVGIPGRARKHIESCGVPATKRRTERV